MPDTIRNKHIDQSVEEIPDTIQNKHRVRKQDLPLVESNFSFRKYQHVNLAQFSERIIILVTHCVLQTTWNTMQYKIIKHSVQIWLKKKQYVFKIMYIIQ